MLEAKANRSSQHCIPYRCFHLSLGKPQRLRRNPPVVKLICQRIAQASPCKEQHRCGYRAVMQSIKGATPCGKKAIGKTVVSMLAGSGGYGVRHRSRWVVDDGSSSEAVFPDRNFGFLPRCTPNTSIYLSLSAAIAEWERSQGFCRPQWRRNSLTASSSFELQRRLQVL